MIDEAQFRTDAQLRTLFNMHKGRYTKQYKGGGFSIDNCCIFCDDPVDLQAFAGHVADLCTVQELILELLVRRG